ncbi:MAG: LysM domain-containing protein [Rubrivivax sp.]
MTRPPFCRQLARLSIAMAAGALAPGFAGAAEPSFPISPQQRGTAQQVAQAGVPLSALAPNAPDSHTVQPGDTLWDISKLFLTSPWRWPELWGMNLDQIRNPHLIYPGQVLVLEKTGDRARLRLAQAGTGAPGNTVKLTPRVRANLLDNDAIGSIPLHLIGPFLNEAVIFSDDELRLAPRVAAAQEGHVSMYQGQVAYVLGDTRQARDFRLFREPRPLFDFGSKEVLGYEARYVGTAEFVRPGREIVGRDGKPEVVPSTVSIKSARLEVNVGDRLAPLPTRDLEAYAPHSPNGAIDGRVLSIYGEGLSAGQNQIVAINKGARDGLERGHVLALWRQGERTVDRFGDQKTQLQLPNERNGVLFVFRVFDKASYALIMSVNVPVFPGDSFTQP